MPKIGTRFVKAKNDITVEVILHYIEKEFIVIPTKDEFINPASNMLVHKGSRGKSLRGVVGSTEEEALASFKIYINNWVDEMLTKKPIIFIQIKGSTGENYYYPETGEGAWNSTRQTGCKVDFVYFYGYSLKVGENERYFRDGEYSKIGKDQEIYRHNINDFVIIDYAPELLKKCEEIIDGLNNMTVMMQSLFKDSESAIKTLLTSNVKLLNF